LMCRACTEVACSPSAILHGRPPGMQCSRIIDVPCCLVPCKILHEGIHIAQANASCIKYQEAMVVCSGLPTEELVDKCQKALEDAWKAWIDSDCGGHKAECEAHKAGQACYKLCACATDVWPIPHISHCSGLCAAAARAGQRDIDYHCGKAAHCDEIEEFEPPPRPAEGGG
jgi:hypothetical protein